MSYRLVHVYRCSKKDVTVHVKRVGPYHIDDTVSIVFVIMNKDLNL